MMTINDIVDYVARKSNLTKCDFITELSEDESTFYVIKTKETYVFEDEGDANDLVDQLRQDLQFIGVEKKYKAGKMNKAGEEVTPETWTVVAKMAH